MMMISNNQSQKQCVMHLIDASDTAPQQTSEQQSLNTRLEYCFRNARAEMYSNSVAKRATRKRVIKATVTAIILVVAFLIGRAVDVPLHIPHIEVATEEQAQEQEISYIRYGYMERMGVACLMDDATTIQVFDIMEDDYLALPGDNVEIGFNYKNEPISCTLRQ